MNRLRGKHFIGRTKFGRGQVSTEFMFAVVILMLLFVVVLLLIQQTKQQAEVSQHNIQEQEVCVKLSSVITYMSSNPPYTQTQLDLLLDANVVNGRVFVGDTFCPFLGSAQNTQLFPGLVNAFDVNGIVVFTNDLNYNPITSGSGGTGSNSTGNAGVFLLTDDQGNKWYDEVAADDTSYAVSRDDASVDPDWVEFDFPNLGLTSASVVSGAAVYIRHFESNLAGLGGIKSMIQCSPDGNTWTNVESYAPSFTETGYYSPDLRFCLSDWNALNHARIRMTYEPNGTGDTISIDYGRIDVNYVQNGSIIDLWEATPDRPQPLDFATDVNSTANTFGPGAGNDGWDWNKNQYGGSLNAALFGADPNDDGNHADGNVSVVHQLQIKIGGGAPGAPANPDDNAIHGMAASGAYGVQFDINAQMYSLIQGGAQALFSFGYTIDADAGWGNPVDAEEEGWIKARFGKAGSMTYLGTSLDTNDDDADATPEIWWSNAPANTNGFFVYNVAPLITGAGTYYLDMGGGLSDWDSRNEGMGIYLDNINLVVV